MLKTLTRNPAPEWTTRLRTTHPYQTAKITLRLATLRRRPHIGIERVYLGQQTHRPEPTDRGRGAGRRICVLEPKRSGFHSRGIHKPARAEHFPGD